MNIKNKKKTSAFQTGNSTFILSVRFENSFTFNANTIIDPDF